MLCRKKVYVIVPIKFTRRHVIFQRYLQHTKSILAVIPPCIEDPRWKDPAILAPSYSRDPEPQGFCSACCFGGLDSTSPDVLQELFLGDM